MANTATRQKFLNWLIAKGALPAEQTAGITQEMAELNKNLEQVLVDKRLMEEEQVIKLKAEFLGLAYADLTNLTVKEEILNNLPVEIAENYKVICFAKIGNKLSIGVVDPKDFKAISAIDFLATKNGFQVNYFYISQSSFNNVFRQYKKFSKEIAGALASKEKADIAEGEGDKKIATDINFEEIVKNAPVAKIVAEIIRHAVEAGASDIHIEPLPDETRVRYRVDGVLHSSLTLPSNVHDSVISRIKVLAKLKLDETRIPQGGRIRLSINKKEIDFRVSVLPLMGQEKVVLRILDTTKGVMTLEELGFVGTNLKIIQNNIKKTSGILLVTGPTGSGKSTTLYSILNILNKEGVNIVTLEDPVEYFIEGVNQSQIRPEIGFTFASGLRSLLRQDPNIMMIGEIRDNETAELAIHAALTGHLVLSTLHTNDAIGAVPRLLDMHVEGFLLGSVLDMVIAQRLTRRLCDTCKKPAELPEKLKAELKAETEKIPQTVIESNLPNFDFAKVIFYQAVGCAHCGRTGYRSRVALAEVLDVNLQIREAILSKRGMVTLEEVRQNQPFVTVEQDGLIKVMQGLTTLEEVRRVMKT